MNKVNEIDIVWKSKTLLKDIEGITNSEEAVQYARPFFTDQINIREQFFVCGLNRANKPKFMYRVSIGGVHGTIVDPKLVFAPILKALCSGIILFHNHPSNTLKPSETDIKLTKKIQEGGEILDVILLDHIILIEDGYYSFKDKGVI